MVQAQLIVIQAAPPRVTEGFVWELHQIDKNALWSKTLAVLPPLPAPLLRPRCRRFSDLLVKIGVNEPTLPVDPAQVLTALSSNEHRWTVFVSNARNESTYIAALMEATGRIRNGRIAPPIDQGLSVKSRFATLIDVIGMRFSRSI